MPIPPQPEKRPVTRITHGDTCIDDYFWLRERENPEVVAHIEAENHYTDAMTSHTAALRSRLYDEMYGRLREDEESARDRYGAYRYFTRGEIGKQYPIFCRCPIGDDRAVETLLDVNELATGQAFTRIGLFLPRYDGRLLAYSVDHDGSETYTLHIRDLASGELLDSPIPNTYYGAAWSSDGQSLFYVTLDDSKRPWRVYHHVLGSDPAQDTLVHEEADPLFYVGVGETLSQAYILLTIHSNTTSEVRAIPAAAPETPPATLLPRRHQVEYTAYHRGDHFYFLTNDQALNFRVLRAPVDDVRLETLEEVIPHRADVKIDYLALFADYLAAFERAEGLERITIHDLRSGESHQVAFPEPVYTLDSWHYNAFWDPNLEYETSTLRITYQSLIQPRTTYDYDMAARRLETRKVADIPGYDSLLYRMERLFAAAPDGVRVPISIVYRADAARPGLLWLHGYGAYGAISDPYFSSEKISLLDRGVAFAIAHIRGGGELGRAWYEAGKMLNKRNTFTDFIACAEHLIAEGYTTPDRLAISGRSAGGLLMGAVTTMRPDLFRCVIAGVPFVDVINTMLDVTIPLTATEFEEWGNPAIPEQYEYLKSYSPYEHTVARAYPAILATAGFHDPRVQYWEPAKWVAKLREVKTDTNPVLLKTEMIAGHSGPSGRYERLRNTAFEYAFVLDQLGIQN